MRKILSFIVAAGICFSSFITANAASGKFDVFSPKETIELGTHTYALYDVYMPWKKAKEYCENLGGHLVTITSEAEQQLIESLVSTVAERKMYWMGMTCEDTEGNWRWITNEPFEYSNWDVREPDSFHPNCSFGVFRNATHTSWYINATKWGDYTNQGYIPEDVSYCHKYPEDFGFICEWDDIYIPDRQISLTKYEYSDEKNTLKVIGNAKNNTGSPLSASAVFAVYNAEGTLKDVCTRNVSVGINSGSDAEAVFENYTHTKGDYVKMFLWNGMGGMTPLTYEWVGEFDPDKNDSLVSGGNGSIDSDSSTIFSDQQ